MPIDGCQSCVKSGLADPTSQDACARRSDIQLPLKHLEENSETDSPCRICSLIYSGLLLFSDRWKSGRDHQVTISTMRRNNEWRIISRVLLAWKATEISEAESLENELWLTFYNDQGSLSCSIEKKTKLTTYQKRTGAGLYENWIPLSPIHDPKPS